MERLQRVDRLLRKPCRILQRLADILRLQIRIGSRISAMVIPLATRFTINETVNRMPRRHARPPMTWESKVMRSNPSMGILRFVLTLPWLLRFPKQTNVLCQVSHPAHTMQLLQPNARFQPRRRAGARHERTLFAVACKPLFGQLLTTEASAGRESTSRRLRQAHEQSYCNTLSHVLHHSVP